VTSRLNGKNDNFFYSVDLGKVEIGGGYTSDQDQDVYCTRVHVLCANVYANQTDDISSSANCHGSSCGSSDNNSFIWSSSPHEF
jgi:hypothetical protein